MALLFRNARLLLPEGVRDDLELLARDGRIAGIRAATTTVHEGQTIDLQGDYLAPGFIDLHVHGARGRDTMEGTREALAAICDYHASGGTTALCLTTASAPLAQVCAVLESLRAARANLPQILGVHVEGPFLSPARAGAQRVEFLCDPDARSVQQLLHFAEIIRRVTLAPELPGAPEAIAQFCARGIAVSGGHSDAWEEEVRAAFACGMRQVTHTFNCMSSMRTRGTERVAGLLECALSEPEIFCELIADGRHVSPTLMKMLYRAKGADGICLVTDATPGAGRAEGTHFDLAGNDCVVADGACWLADRSRLAGSAARMIDLVRTMVQAVGVPLPAAVRMASATPARALGLTSQGELRAGAAADLVVLSPQLQVRRTFHAGVEIFSEGKEKARGLE